ncbi:B12-binding domain-containing radical SAM protein [Phaeodactylibacter xiamenensis]|uniref:B12-binding domain-containing radical SAM protein n=1 Tax=Phaeodactylibacter xiamenensis TaxID=1524460 RepID=UPI003BAACF08
MKILLVRPPVPKHTIGLKNVMICEPLELEYVAAGLEGHDVQIMDMILEKGFTKRLRSFSPDVICTSCYISGVNEVIKLCRKAKIWNRKVKTIVGGVHASRCAEDFADPAIDCIVLGDGTSQISTIVEALGEDKALLSVSGLALPVGPNKVLKTKGKAYMPNADTLPLPRRDLVAHLQHRYYYIFHRPVATMKTAWGCWYKCNFCFTWRITDGHPYARSPESIVEELEQIEAEDVYIVDDIFLIKSSRLNKLAALIRERGIKKKYLVYARADYIAENEDIIADWAELGLSAVFIGLEATTNPELDSMDKECSVDLNEKSIAVCRKYGVDVYGSLIPGPDYTEQEWKNLFAFIERNKLYYVNISPLTPMPGTLIWDLYKDRITVPREAHGLWDLSHMLIETKMPLKQYYRWLLKTYMRTMLDISRADRYALRTRPPVWSFRYFRIWKGMIKIMFQFLTAHRHHTPRELAKAMYKGEPVPGLDYRDWASIASTLETEEWTVQEKVQNAAFS